MRLLLALLALSSTLPAQSLFGTLLGTVTDTTNAVIPTATVRIRNISTNAIRTVTTDNNGDYQVPSLPVGTYEITCEAKGFKRTVVREIPLAVDQRARVDLRLEIGTVEQSVEVTTTAPLIETDTPSQGMVVDNRRIVQLPLNGRNFQQLAVLAPGVIAPVAGSGDRFAVSGTRGLSNSFMMDGASNTNANANTTFINPSIDVIQEFKIQRNTFNAEYGRGAAQINVVTRTGTNRVRLTLFEFVRNDALQARNFFDRERKPALRRNQFGGTAGGPVAIPKLYGGRDRSFWLVNYEGTRQRSPSTRLSTLPTQAELDGDLSSTTAAVRDPSNQQPFPGNRIPAARINATTRAYRPYMPVTSLPRGAFGPGINFITAVSGVNDSDQLTVRGDHHITSQSLLLGRYTYNDNNNRNPSIVPLYEVGAPSRQQSALLGHNHVLRPNLINEFRLSFSRHSLWQGPGFPHPNNVAETLGLRNILSRTAPAFNSIPVVNLTGFTGIGGPALITQRVNNWDLVDNMTWIRSSHTLKFGVDLRRIQLDIRNIGPTAGSFNFQGTFTGNAIGDYLLGIARTATGTAPPPPEGVNVSRIWQWFVQDDWKVTSNLTLSFGARYEYPEPWVNTRDRRSIFDPTFPGGRLIYPDRAAYFVPGTGFVNADRPLASRGLTKPDKNNFAPRFGFAWRPFGNSRNSVRGSYGIFHEAPNSNNEALFGTFNFPHVLQHSLTNDVTRPTFTWSDTFPNEVQVGAVGFSSLAPDLPVGYMQQWSLNIQREITSGTAVELGYLGSKGTKLDWRNHANQAVRDVDPARPTAIALRLPYPAFAPGANTITRNGFSNYHGFIARLERSFSQGFSFLAAYTGSKAIDNSSFAGNIGSQPAEALNAYDRRSEKALSYFDVTHRLVLSSIWDLPIGRGKILGGWQLTSIVQFQSGNPWSVLIAGDWANVGTGGQRASLVGDPFPSGFSKGGPSRRRFDPAAFALPPRGTFGNSGRNIIRDAGLNNFDLGLYKDIMIGEEIRIEFRAEAYNAWNHTQFNQFDNVINNPTFATWTTARAPRIFQLGLKLVY